MNEFKLPETTTCEVSMLTDPTPTLVGKYVWVRHAELGLIQIDKGKLTEVVPPLPPIPDAPVLRIGAEAWVRVEEHPWNIESHFYNSGYGPKTWAELQGLDPEAEIVPHVPDPAAVEREPEWSYRDQWKVKGVEYGGKLSAMIDTNRDVVFLDVDAMRGLAAWLLREVREAETPLKSGVSDDDR